MFSDYVTILLTIITIINSALGLMILFSPQKQASTRIYALINLTTLAWIWSIIFYRLSDQINILFWTKTLYVSASLIASCFLFFSYLFPVKDNFPLSRKILIIAPNIAIVLMTIFGDSIIKSAEVREGTENLIVFGKLYILYVIYILFFFNYAFTRLFIKYRKLTEDYQKRQLVFFFLGYFISALIAFTTNLLLPWFGYFSLNWLGQVSTVFIVTFATYAIVRHQLFNIKAVAAELFIGSLWIFVLIRIILATTAEERLMSGALFLITIFIGIFLIKSIINEVKAREKIQALATQLEQTNIHLQELDQQKSEFVSLASHQLRGPLTAIRGYASMLLDGDFGQIQAEVKDAIDKIFASTKDLLVVVEDYLNVSRIEQGRMQYDYSIFDLRELAATVVTELRPNIERAHLTIEYDYDMHGDYRVNADMGKIKQVVSNLIDNAIKYTPQGSIHVWLTHGSKETVGAHAAPGTGEIDSNSNTAAENVGNPNQSANSSDMNRILLCISDTGVGILPEVLPRLFEKFTRAPDASKTNIMGTGLGLYVARKMIEAHGGKIWAESGGINKGSTFFIELRCAE